MYLKNPVQLTTSPSLLSLLEAEHSREEEMKYHLNSLLCYIGSLASHPVFLPALCLFSVKSHKWEQAMGLKNFGSFSVRGGYAHAVRGHFCLFRVFTGVPSSASCRSSPIPGRVTVATPRAPFWLSYDHRGGLASDLPLVCSLTF